MKKVWLEITHLLVTPTRHPSGIGYYTQRLIDSLAERQKPNITYSLVGNSFITNRISSLVAHNPMSKKLFRLFPGKIFNQLVKRGLLPPLELLYRGRPDLIVTFNYVRFPTLKNTRTITTIHDLTYIRFPEYVESKNRAFLEKTVPHSIKASSMIITLSEASKKDLIDEFGLSPDDIRIVPPGVDPSNFKNAELNQKQRQKYKIPGEYLLYLGTIEPRKNIDGIIRSYSLLSAKTQCRFALVLAGGSGWHDQDIQQQIRDYEGPGSIILPGYIDAADIASIYSGARAFVFPSHYEGFGMPVLEAMASGTPVITANNSSLPQAAGDAAILVDSRNIDELSQAMERITADDKLCAELVAKGYEHVKLFSWSKSAQQLEEAIEYTLTRPSK